MRIRSAAGLLLLFLAACASEPPPQVVSPAVEFAALKPAGTPTGAFNSDVTQATIMQTICVPRWTETVRPPTSYTDSIKLKLMADNHFPASDASKYELDHFIPLALGGHPRSTENLWLQPWDGQWGAHVKDRLERKLQLMVCAGKISLKEAREAIQTNWIQAFKKYVDLNEPLTMPPVD